MAKILIEKGPNLRFDEYCIDKILKRQYCEELYRALDSRECPDSLFADFEGLFSSYIGRKYAVIVDSGSRALKISLEAIGAKNGDMVMLPNLMHPSILEAVRFLNCMPILAGVEKGSLNIDADAVEYMVSSNKKIKFMFLAYLFGMAPNIKKIMAIAERHKIAVVEDASQGIGGCYNSVNLGNFGDISVFSLSAPKPVSAPGLKAGIILCNDKRHYMRVLRLARDLSCRPPLAALPFLKVRLKNVDMIVSKIKNVNVFYDAELSGLKEYVKIFANDCSMAQEYPILAKSRDKLKHYLLRHGVPLEKQYTPFNYSLQDNSAKFIVSEQYFSNCVHLPVFPCMVGDGKKFIVRMIKKFYHDGFASH